MSILLANEPSALANNVMSEEDNSELEDDVLDELSDGPIPGIALLEFWDSLEVRRSGCTWYFVLLCAFMYV